MLTTITNQGSDKRAIDREYASSDGRRRQWQRQWQESNERRTNSIECSQQQPYQKYDNASTTTIAKQQQLCHIDGHRRRLNKPAHKKNPSDASYSWQCIANDDNK